MLQTRSLRSVTSTTRAAGEKSSRSWLSICETTSTFFPLGKTQTPRWSSCKRSTMRWERVVCLRTWKKQLLTWLPTSPDTTIFQIGNITPQLEIRLFWGLRVIPSRKTKRNTLRWRRSRGTWRTERRSRNSGSTRSSRDKTRRRKQRRNYSRPKINWIKMYKTNEMKGLTKPRRKLTQTNMKISLKAKTTTESLSRRETSASCSRFRRREPSQRTSTNQLNKLTKCGRQESPQQLSQILMRGCTGTLNFKQRKIKTLS